MRKEERETRFCPKGGEGFKSGLHVSQFKYDCKYYPLPPSSRSPLDGHAKAAWIPQSREHLMVKPVHCAQP